MTPKTLTLIAALSASSVFLAGCGPKSTPVAPDSAPAMVEQAQPGELPPVTDIETASPLPTPKSLSNPVTKSSSDDDLEQMLNDIDSDLGTVMPGANDLNDIE